MYQYKLRLADDRRLELRVGWLWRVFFLGCCGLLSTAVFDGGRIHVVPAALAVICLLAGLYDDRWLFDRSAGTVESRAGALPLLHRRSYALDRLQAIRLRSVQQIGAQGHADLYSRPAIPRALQRNLVRLSLLLRDEDGSPVHVNVQTESMRRYDHLFALGQALAEFCQVPFEPSETR